MNAISVLRRFIILFALVFVFLVPVVFAAPGDDTSTNPRPGDDTSTNPRPGDDLGGAKSNCGHDVAAGALINPLKACNIPEFLIAIVDVLIIFATPIIVIYIMYAGFKFVTAQGNPSEIESARAALLWAVVGGVIVLGAKLILEVIEGTIKAFGV